ncbi:hypothetical protein RhiJN_00974 [Ceratobasidium sp. AG-Ba]|nr:hypothetical protein RhiJN_00974 [Ceratobasidium sp. AG-Ba]
MPPFFDTNTTHTFLEVGQHTELVTAPVPPAMEPVVFILCVVFGSLLGCIMLGVMVYYTRRYMERRRRAREERLHRDASFLVGAPSTYRASAPLTTPSHLRRSRRPSARRTRIVSTQRLAIPSLELGSVFRIDPATMRRGSSATSIPGLPSDTPPMPERTLPPKFASGHRQSLFSNGSTLVGPASPPTFDKHVTLRVANPPPITSPHAPTINVQLQKPNPVYRVSPSPSREHLVTSTDSLASTPPLSPEATSHSHQGAFMTPAPTDVITPVASVRAMRETLGKQSMSSIASSHRQQQQRVEQFEPSPYLAGLDYTPFVLPAVQEQDSPPLGAPPLNRCRSADEVLRGSGSAGTPVTLSHFPFRFSHTGGASSPGVSSIRSTSGGGPSPPSAFKPQRHASGRLNNKASAWTLPNSTPPLKLKIRHAASDEIIAVAFAPHTITYAAVCDAVRTRLGFKPRRVLRDDHVQISDDNGLWTWLDEQYTKGHTRLMLQVE